MFTECFPHDGERTVFLANPPSPPWDLPSQELNSSIDSSLKTRSGDEGPHYPVKRSSMAVSGSLLQAAVSWQRTHGPWEVGSSTRGWSHLTYVLTNNTLHLNQILVWTAALHHQKTEACSGSNETYDAGQGKGSPALAKGSLIDSGKEVTPPPHWASSCVFSPKLLGLHILSLCPFHLFLVKTFKIFYSSYFKIGNIYKTLVTRSYNRTLVHFPTRAFDPSHAFLASTKSEIVLFVFCSWLISLNFMSFWLIQVAPDDMILPFWCLNNKYVVYMYHVFFAHLCGLILVFWLLWTVLQSTWKWRHLRNHWGHWKTIWWAIFLSSSHFSFALVAVHFCCTH